VNDRRDLVGVYRAALEAVRGDRAVERSLTAETPGPGPFYVLGAGKAACAMARGARAALGDRIVGGLVVTKHGHGSPVDSIEVREAGHPVPDASSLAAANEALARAASLPPDVTLLVLISGGASALWTAPVHGVTLEDIRTLTELLLRSGADIQASNAVRKHLSRIKGGVLARVATAPRVLTLAISDVEGDRLDVIGSGPTTPDPTTYGDALEALRSCGVLAAAPQAVREHLERGAAGGAPETPKPGDLLFERTEHRVIASLGTALRAAEAAADRRGLRARGLGACLYGPAHDEAHRLAQLARRARAEGIDLLIAGGEPIVRVTGDGRGGRAQELALAFALEVDGGEGVTALFAGTDGSDGPTDAAGALVDQGTIARARALRLDARSYLVRNDSYGFFRVTGELLVTGPTGTNVADLALVCVHDSQAAAREARSA
jgi:glycerate-2-kinase